MRTLYCFLAQNIPLVLSDRFGKTYDPAELSWKEYPISTLLVDVEEGLVWHQGDIVTGLEILLNTYRARCGFERGITRPTLVMQPIDLLILRIVLTSDNDATRTLILLQG